jgi:hypothetical protein
MRIRARYRLATTTLCAAACAAGVLALTGCAPSPASIANSSASPTADAPAFASEADALEAARTAYAAFATMSTSVGHDGGKSPERMANVATGDALTYELHSLQDLANRSVKGTGEFSFDSLTLQSADLASGTVVTYICLDVSNADVVDASGASTLPPDRPTRYPLEVTFAFDASKDRLLVTRSDSWTGTNFC